MALIRLGTMSLARKIQIGTVTIIVFFAALIITYALNITSKYFLNEGKCHGDILTKNLALQAVGPLLTQDSLRLRNLVAKASMFNERVAYCFVMSNAPFVGGESAVQAHSFGDSFPVDLLRVNTLKPWMDTQIVLLDTDQGHIYDLVARIKVGEKSLGIVRLGIWQDALLQSVHALLMAIGIVSLMVLLVAVIASSLFANRVTRRLHALRARAEHLVHYDLASNEDPLDAEKNALQNLKYGDEITAVDVSFTQLSTALHHHVENLRASQAQLLQVQKMDSLGALAGGVAHEINTPLGIILGYAQLLQEDIPEHFGVPQGQVRKDLAIIERQAKTCRKIVADLLSFSRQSNATHEKRHMCFNNSVMEVVRLVEHAFALEHVFIETYLDDRLPAIYGNPTTLRQVWMNMLNNARDAMPQGGLIYITTHLDLEKIKVTASFADTGSGIAKEHIHAIFDPFFTTKPVDKGTGLGLSVSFGIIQEHHGIMRVVSPLPQGALPLSMAAETLSLFPHIQEELIAHAQGKCYIEKKDTALHVKPFRFGAGTCFFVSLPLEYDEEYDVTSDDGSI